MRKGQLKSRWRAVTDENRLDAIHTGKAQVRFFVYVNDKNPHKPAGFFHFFAPTCYDTPQFGDLYNARAYLTKSAATQRKLALQKFGYKEVLVMKELVYIDQWAY